MNMSLEKRRALSQNLVAAPRLALGAMMFAVLAALSIGCGSDRSDGPDRVTIAVIPKGTTHAFWKAIHAGAEKAARELDIDVIWKGPSREDDRDAQIAEVENFISRGVSGIVLAPTDDKALRIPVRNATRSDVPVVIMDSALDSEDFVSFVATDNYLGGRLAGERMAEVLGGRGRVVMLRYMEGSASTMKREQGFLDALGTFQDIELVSTNQYAGATAESAYQAGENLLSRFEQSTEQSGVDGIYCPNESSAFGMLRALQDRELAGEITLIGFDASEQMVRALERGEFDSLVLQDPVNMAYLAVKTLVAHLNGESVQKRIDTGVSLVTRDTMNEPKNQVLLRPDIDQYLQ